MLNRIKQRFLSTGVLQTCYVSMYAPIDWRRLPSCARSSQASASPIVRQQNALPSRRSCDQLQYGRSSEISGPSGHRFFLKRAFGLRKAASKRSYTPNVTTLLRKITVIGWSDRIQDAQVGSFSRSRGARPDLVFRRFSSFGELSALQQRYP